MQCSSSVVSSEDPTDSVAIVTPYFTEIDLWPLAAPAAVAAAPALKESECEDSIVAISSRSIFLKEARNQQSLRFLENAVCDLR